MKVLWLLHIIIFIINSFHFGSDSSALHSSLLDTLSKKRVLLTNLSLTSLKILVIPNLCSNSLASRLKMELLLSSLINLYQSKYHKKRIYTRMLYFLFFVFGWLDLAKGKINEILLFIIIKISQEEPFNWRLSILQGSFKSSFSSCCEICF